MKAQNVLTTSFGDFQIELEGLYYQTYKFNDKPIGISEFLKVDGQVLGMYEGTNYLVWLRVTEGS